MEGLCLKRRGRRDWGGGRDLDSPRSRGESGRETSRNSLHSIGFRSLSEKGDFFFLYFREEIGTIDSAQWDDISPPEWMRPSEWMRHPRPISDRRGFTVRPKVIRSRETINAAKDGRLSPFGIDRAPFGRRISLEAFWEINSSANYYV